MTTRRIPKEVYKETLRQFFAPIVPLLDDPLVSEIMVNGPDEVHVECRGQISKTDVRFASTDQLTSALRHLGQYLGRRLDSDNPVLEGHLPDGSRIEAVIPPAAPDGPLVAIRCFAPDALTAETLLVNGSVTAGDLDLLQRAVSGKHNVLISGGTGSGKTSLLNVLSSFVPASERIILLEDTRELQLQQPHVARLETQPADPKGHGAVTMRDLFRASLRLRPDRIVVGEIRGPEALELIAAMTSGHGGCLSTVHASHPIDAMHRLETMAMMSDIDLPLAALRDQLVSAVELIVQIERQPGGQRRVNSICQITGRESTGDYRLQEISGTRASEVVFRGPS